MEHRATYSPEDNKLRLYPAHRLSADDYARVKAMGFSWAPKQELFVAPMWTPQRADFLEEFAGEIEDEDTSLCDRAEQRAERFEDYSDKRGRDAEQARKAVARIADGIPLGQPILVGHHSERHARRDAEKIENGMRRAVKMWETSAYWTQRAAGAIRAAKYKERPDVRARRIKTLEADKRKQERYKAEAETSLKLWTREGLTLEQARLIANHSRLTVTRTNADGTPNTNGGWSAYDVLQPDGERYKACPACTVEQVQEAARRAYPRTIAHCERWIEHYDNRIAYERAMLAEAGGTVADQVRPEKGGAVRCLWGPRGGWAYIVKVNRVTVTIRHQWNEGGRVFAHNEPLDKLREVMTRAQVEEARAQGRIKEAPEGIGFWLLQSREDFDKAEAARAEPAPQQPEREQFEAMRESLRAGVQIVAAPQLFPTPRELAQRMADEAGIQPGMRLLEPSAGTGAILNCITVAPVDVVAVEIRHTLADRLRETQGARADVVCADFLSIADPECFIGTNPEPKPIGTFDRIVMNPPFENAADLKHIEHARRFLKPGGRLVAICANGPRQRKELMPLADLWEDLPPGTFKEQGTNVNTALVVIEG